MDDITTMINDFLNSKDGLNQLQAVLSSLNLTPQGIPTQNNIQNNPQNPNNSPASPELVNNILSTLSQNGHISSPPNWQPQTNQSPSQPAGGFNIDPAMIQNVMSMLGSSPNTQQHSNSSSPPAGGLNIDPAMIQSIMSALGNSGNSSNSSIPSQSNMQSTQQASTPAGGFNIDPAMIQSVMSALGNSGNSSTPSQPNMQSTQQASSPVGGFNIDPAMIQSVMSALGNSGNPGNSSNSSTPSQPNMQSTQQASAPAGGFNIDPAMIQSVMSALGGGGNNGGTDNGLGNLGALGSILGNVDMGTILKVTNAISTATQPDKNTGLLMALKPHFSEERQKKVDDAVRFMQLLKLLPIIKETGILKIFGGEGLWSDGDK